MDLETLNIIQSVQKLSPANNNSDLQSVVALLLEGKIELQGLFPWSSNYTFLTTLTHPSETQEIMAVYKPCQGERPLWDFPEGSLCQREFAAYLVSLVLGWPHIPPVVFREDAPHGAGSLQLFINADYEQHYFTLRHETGFVEDFRQMALFDFIINNADRKGGHCLKDEQNKIWAIDHGLTFHVEPKLRTVIWEHTDEAIAPYLLADLKRLRQLLNESTELCLALQQVITPSEFEAFENRIDYLLETVAFPAWSPGHNVPYPPI